MALGVTIRLVRLLLDHPLWGDECFVAANLIERGYLGLLRPLDYQQVAPVLFLWAELAVVELLGFSEWSLRLFPTACAIAGLFAFRHLAGRLMKGLPLLMGVAIVAVALNPIRHGGEAKPYATDFLASTVLLAMAVEWWRRPERSTWLWALAASTPLAMGLSLPSIFVAGRDQPGDRSAGPGGPRRPGVVGGLPRVQRGDPGRVRGDPGRLRRGRVGRDQGVHGSLLVGDVPAARSTRSVWSLWLVRAHTGQLFAYPVGGANGGSLLTAILASAGIVDLCRRGRGTIAAACVAPLGLALVASAIRLYPYGESERLMQFEGPMICLLAGYGLALGCGRLRRPGSYRRPRSPAWSGSGRSALGAIVADVVRPAKTPEDLRAREFARWFWTEAGRDAELACARVNLGLDFEGGPSHYGRSADYLTYQKIFSSRHRQGRPLDWARVSTEPPAPLRALRRRAGRLDPVRGAGWAGWPATTGWPGSRLTGSTRASPRGASRPRTTSRSWSSSRRATRSTRPGWPARRGRPTRRSSRGSLSLSGP